MKKAVLSMAVMGLVAFGFTSCKKDYVCQCTYTTPGASGTVSQTYENTTKADAQEQCNGYASANGTSLSCSIQ